MKEHPKSLVSAHTLCMRANCSGPAGLFQVAFLTLSLKQCYLTGDPSWEYWAGVSEYLSLLYILSGSSQARGAGQPGFPGPNPAQICQCDYHPLIPLKSGLTIVIPGVFNT